MQLQSLAAACYEDSYEALRNYRPRNQGGQGYQQQPPPPPAGGYQQQPGGGSGRGGRGGRGRGRQANA